MKLNCPNRVLFILNVLHLSFTLTSVRLSLIPTLAACCKVIATDIRGQGTKQHDSLHRPVRALPAILKQCFSMLTSCIRLTSILTWRFLLDLQEANQRDLKLDSDDPLHMSMPHEPGDGSLNFARVMGSIGSIVVSQGADDVEHHGSSDDVPGDYELAEVANVDVTATIEGEFGTEAQAGGDGDPGPI